jgi:hypothetical protein
VLAHGERTVCSHRERERDNTTEEKDRDTHSERGEFERGENWLLKKEVGMPPVAKTLEPMKLPAPDPDAKPRVETPMTGSNYEQFSLRLLNSTMNALYLKGADEEDRRAVMEACLQAMAGIAPRDEVEGMLAAQIVACHHGAMECFRRAMMPDQNFESRKMNLNFANKLTRTYALHMESLDKHRGKGQQTVRVEHVTVNAGGQAIVGQVTTGGGAPRKSEEQSHAKAISHAPEPQMRCPCENDRQALPVASDEER